ncbi:MAG: prepilin-type N-terminal cleavage/methylation domain-containing protein [Verrucomicrobiota bacterium JB024]|nr:prepilin-type N-terminal cleavage/methylation domain-containing protein [Verrucomicrobiota bacterium JB024]
MHDLHHSNPDRRGFSLVELLAALAVIAVLSAIVLSVMHSVRAKTDNVKCANNLRQMFVYLSAYTQEHNGDLPAVMDADEGISWWLNLQHYIDSPDQVVGTNKESIFLCPAAIDTYSNGEARRTYAMNIEGIPDWRIPINLFQIEDPGRSLLIMDAADSAAGGGDAYSYFRLAQLQRTIDPRHGGTFNVLFADGHVGSHEPSDSSLESYVVNLNQ